MSRMSRNAEEGIKTYFELFDRGVELVFLKEAYINTATYADNLKDKIELTGTDEDEIFKGLNNYFRKLAERQIRIAFEQAEKEVTDLHQRTKEGLETALDFPSGAIGLLEKGLEIFHSRDGAGDVLSKRDVELVNGVQIDLYSPISDSHFPQMEPIIVNPLDRDVDYLHRVTGILVFYGYDIYYSGKLACLGKQACGAEECDKKDNGFFHRLIKISINILQI